MEISKMLTLSTSHVTEATLTKLESEATDNNYPCLSVYKKEDFGYIIYIDKHAYNRDHAGDYLPGDLRTVVAFTIETGCNILCLDCDGEELVCIPHYEYTSDTQDGMIGSIQTCICGGEILGAMFIPRR